MRGPGTLNRCHRGLGYRYRNWKNINTILEGYTVSCLINQRVNQSSLSTAGKSRSSLVSKKQNFQKSPTRELDRDFRCRSDSTGQRPIKKTESNRCNWRNREMIGVSKMLIKKTMRRTAVKKRVKRKIQKMRNGNMNEKRT